MNNKELTRLVAAMVLGDGYLRMFRNGKNAAYGFSQILDHEDYINWQAETLESITGVTVRKYDTSERDGVRRKAHAKLESKCHPFLTTLYERHYHNGRKTVSVHDLKLLDWQSLAIWYMDDGYILKTADTSASLRSQRGNVFLCTDCYTHAEVILLQRAIYEKFDLPFNVRKRGSYYRLVATKDNAARFLEEVSPFIFPSFEYKLSSERLTPEKGGDIVCTSQQCEELGRDDQALLKAE